MNKTLVMIGGFLGLMVLSVIGGFVLGYYALEIVLPMGVIGSVMGVIAVFLALALWYASRNKQIKTKIISCPYCKRKINIELEETITVETIKKRGRKK